MDRRVRFLFNKSITLLELLIAITLMGLIVLGFSSIELFSRYQVVTADKRAQVQNEASYILEHMAKEIGKAIGDKDNVAVFIEDSGQRLKVYVDANQDGQRNDHFIAYQYQGSPDYQMRYYSDYPSSSYVPLTNKISSFTPDYTSSNNYVKVELTACDDPDGTPQSCGTPDNPQVSMKTHIKMPSVSVY